MKKISILFICFLLLGIGLFTGCKKEVDNIYTMFKDVQVTFHDNHPFSVADYKLVNDGDSVYVDFTITSNKEDMYTVVVEKVGGASGNSPERTDILTIDEERRSYSGLLKLKMQRDGKTSYRIFAKNLQGHYIGDGYKKVTIEVGPSYMVYADRRIYAPDSVEKVLPSFFSIAKAQSFSYSEGRAVSADIDFGIWRRVVVDNQNREAITYNYYSLSASPNPFPVYDIDDWQKRETMFSTPVKSGTNTFLYNLVSASTIEEQAKTRDINITATDYSVPADGLAPGNLVYFRTPEGKYGVLHVNQVTEDLERRPFINISIKIQN